MLKIDIDKRSDYAWARMHIDPAADVTSASLQFTKVEELKTTQLQKSQSLRQLHFKLNHFNTTQHSDHQFMMISIEHIPLLALVATISVMCLLWRLIQKSTMTKKRDPLFVNYHLTRQCNYSCGFCFHTAKTSHVLSLNDAKRGLKLLADYGMDSVE